MAMKNVNIYQLLGLLFVLTVAFLVLQHGIQILDGKSADSDSGFHGPHWHHPGETVESQQVLDAAYARVESHTIRTSGGKLVPGWIWVDFRNRVDVLVEDEDGNFIVFQQRNYGLKSTSLAVVSRHLEPLEEPLEAAKAELRSEMQRETEDWTVLGEYRGDANRGAGLVTCMLARHTRPIKAQVLEPAEDLEKKDQVILSRGALKDALIGNKFLEVKWAATAALGLMKLEADP
eukprot:TRINITY_DN20878_c0_g1_i1.p1 TRINITY_DN20878_c0_g1~~TRINITY_DN20878_c0_g1_i1.p1  ORF type:complete len:233 (+),score=36.55 TRINITY_DN20878_c0_g1_i1:114-812(+)